MTRVRSEPLFFASIPAASFSQAQLQAEAWSSSFSQQATHFQTIASFAVAGLIGQAARGLFLGSGLVRNAVLNPLLGHGLGLLAESAALTGFQSPSLLETEVSTLHTFRSHLMNLSALKMGGTLFHHSPALIRHLSSCAAMVGAHHLAVTFDWETKNSRSLFEEMLEAEMLTLQMETGNALGHFFTGHHFMRVQQNLARRAEFSQRLETNSSPRIFEYASIDANVSNLRRVKYHPNFVNCWKVLPHHIRMRALKAIEGLSNGNLSKGHQKKKLANVTPTVPLHQIKLSDQHRILLAPRGKSMELLHVGAHNETDRVIRQWRSNPLQESQGSNGFDPFIDLEASEQASRPQSANSAKYQGDVLFEDFWNRYEAEQSAADSIPEMIVEEAMTALRDPNEVLEGRIEEKLIREFPELNTPTDNQIITLSESSLWRGNPDSRLYLHLQTLLNRLIATAKEPCTLEALGEMKEVFELSNTKDFPDVMAGYALEAYRKVHPLDRLRLQSETPQLEKLGAVALRTQALDFILGRELMMGDFNAFIEKSAAVDPLSKIAHWMISSPREYLKFKQRPVQSRAEMYASLIRVFPFCEFTSDFPLSDAELGFWNGSNHDSNTDLNIEATIESLRRSYGEMYVALSRNFGSREISEARTLDHEGWERPAPGSHQDMLTFWNEAPANFRRVLRYYREILGESASQSKLAKVMRHIATLRGLGASTTALENYAVHAFEHAGFIDDKALKEGFESYPHVLEWLERCTEVMEEPMATAVEGQENPDIQRFYDKNNRIAGAAFSRLLRHDEIGQRMSEAAWRKIPEAELTDLQMDAWLPEFHRFVARLYLKNRDFVRRRLPLEIIGNPLLDIDAAERKLADVPYDYPEVFTFNASVTFDKWMMNQHLLGAADPREEWILMETVLENGSYITRTLKPNVADIFRQQRPNTSFDVEGETCTLGPKTEFRPYSPTYRWGLVFENQLSPEMFRLACFCKRFEHPFRARFMQLMNRSSNAMLSGVPTFWAIICFYRRFITEYGESRESILKDIESRLPDFPAIIFKNLPECDLLGLELQTRIMTDFEMARGENIKHAMGALQKAYVHLANHSTGDDAADAPLHRRIAIQFGRVVLRHRQRLIDTLNIPEGLQKTFNSLLDRINSSHTPELCRDSPSFQQTFAILELPAGVNNSGNFAHFYGRAFVLMNLVRERLPILDEFMRDTLSPLARTNGPAAVVATLEFYLAHRQEILDLVPENLQ